MKLILRFISKKGEAPGAEMIYSGKLCSSCKCIILR